MGDDKRTVLSDKKMLEKTSQAMFSGVANIHQGVDVNANPEAPYGPFYARNLWTQKNYDNDSDPRTEHFSKRYSQLCYKLSWAHIGTEYEIASIQDALAEMASTYDAAEDAVIWDVSKFKLPTRFTG